VASFILPQGIPTPVTDRVSLLPIFGLLCILTTGCGLATPPPVRRVSGRDAPIVSSDTASNVVQVPAGVERPWSGIISDADKEKERPASGVIGTEKDFQDLWQSWRGNEELPKIDFAQLFVVVMTSKEDPLVGLSFEGPDASGNIKLIPLVGPGKMHRGFSYVMMQVPRDGIKSVEGKPVTGR
jgi:hypothetical protein